MRGLLLLCLAVLAVSSACGGEGGGSAPAQESGSEATEAAIEFKKRVELDDVLVMCRRHGVRPTQLITWFSFADEEITSAVVVQPGMSDAEITKEFRQASVGTPGEMEGGLPLTDAQRSNIEEVNKQLRTGRLYVRRMLAAGTAEALQSLREEASVRSVFLKPDKPLGQ